VKKDLTCFGLEYCCSLKKSCKYRDKTLENFCISKKKYVKIKNKCKKMFYDKS
jgi:predicted metal-binding transcription factor (methanogenesis marker protein 9)